MINSVCDINGLNIVTRRVFENGAAAMVGMAHRYKPTFTVEKPVVAISTLSIIDKCTVRVRKALEQKGFEVLVFHAQGTGGRAMDEIIREQNVSVVADLATVEISDWLAKGLFDGGPDRGKAALEKGVPTIFAPGCTDMMVAGPIEEARTRFPGRLYHIHNPALTAVRAGAEEFRRYADHMAAIIKQAKGPVAFYVPLGGFSSHDSKEGHLYDPSLPPVLVEHLKKVLPAGVPLTVLPCHINDEEFADRIIEQIIAFQRQTAGSAVAQ
jgi:uncharacterized protein (UPF0261 family)